ncbi:4-alpha-glucanotransferase [Gordonia sp. DT219]|uniref:4-alpha-glucanotransferase n=1 Tax=Gordonia sp. DT219 TaxID=3416658 RepID=UPI003CF9519B
MADSVVPDAVATDAVGARLAELARRSGVATSYVGWGDTDHEVSASTLRSVLDAMGIAADTDEQIDDSLAELDIAAWRTLVAPVTVLTEGDAATLWVHVPHGNPVELTLTTEGGDRIRPVQLDIWWEPREVDGVRTGRASFAVPDGLPPGYHEITATDTVTQRTASAPLIVTPRRLDTADALLGEQRWGTALQLYSVRSSRSWGVGDLADLAEIAASTASTYGADFVQVNPLHAAQPVPPLENSPYLPVTRRFVNPLYIAVTDIPEFVDVPKADRKVIERLAKSFVAEDLSTKKIKRNKAYRAKLAALEIIHRVPLRTARAAAYRQFRRREGEGLRDFATWCALVEEYGADGPEWEGELRDREFVAQQRRRLAERVEFYTWLQWICDEQLALAQRAARAAGMRIGIVADLAVGVGRDGADVWTLGDVLATGATVGVPPDGFNQQGQNWNQPPWHPRRLAESGYAAYRDMLRTVLRHAGGLRVDHILGLFRLWWIPDGCSPAEGTYVHYDHDALIGILALEAQRAGAVVIGEDLGVFEPTVRQTLADRGILGCSILWFEQGAEAPVPPEDYRELCLTSVTTHDLPPTVGYLAGDHITLRAELGLLTESEDADRAREEHDRDAILAMARKRGLWSPDIPLTDPRTVDALYQLIAASPSVLLGVALVDAVGERRIQNQPGTDSDQYPNWCIPLADEDRRPVLIEDLPANARFAALVAALEAAGVGGRPESDDTFG